MNVFLLCWLLGPFICGRLKTLHIFACIEFGCMKMARQWTKKLCVLVLGLITPTLCPPLVHSVRQKPEARVTTILKDEVHQVLHHFGVKQSLHLSLVKAIKGGESQNKMVKSYAFVIHWFIIKHGKSVWGQVDRNSPCSLTVVLLNIVLNGRLVAASVVSRVERNTKCYDPSAGWTASADAGEGQGRGVAFSEWIVSVRCPEAGRETPSLGPGCRHRCISSQEEVIVGCCWVHSPHPFKQSLGWDTRSTERERYAWCHTFLSTVGCHTGSRHPWCCHTRSRQYTRAPGQCQEEQMGWDTKSRPGSVLVGCLSC